MSIQTIRKSKNITQKQLSELSGVPYRTVQRLEANNDCKLTTAKKLAKALNITLDELALEVGN